MTSAAQLQMDLDVPLACCYVDRDGQPCKDRPRWVLYPGATGHCEAHDPRALNEAWEAAFADGSAYVVPL